MKRILVIADDLTGAAEMGGIAFLHGLSAQIQCGRLETYDANAVILDTDTRQCTPTQAAGRVKQLVGHVEPGAFELIYKKTDSVLRGPIAAELNAITSALGIPHAVLLPQNPSRGRVIVNGEYRIDGVPLDHTPLAADPEHPARSARVRELVGGAEAIHIADAGTAEEVRRWAAGLEADTLPAGGADFFQAILRVRGFREHAAPAFRLAGSALVVCGSAVKASRDFVQSRREAWVCPMPQILFDCDPPESKALEQWREEIARHLRESSRAMIAVPQPPIADRAVHVRHAVAEVIGRVLRTQAPDNLLIEGGATAAAVAHGMGWRRFEVMCQVSPGVVGLRVVKSGQLLIIKPGSYPWELRL